MTPKHTDAERIEADFLATTTFNLKRSGAIDALRSAERECRSGAKLAIDRGNYEYARKLLGRAEYYKGEAKALAPNPC